MFLKTAGGSLFETYFEVSELEKNKKMALLVFLEIISKKRHILGTSYCV